MKDAARPAGDATQKLHIWHVSNWCAHGGNEFRESAFRSSAKDFEVLNYALLLVRALEKIPGAEVQSIPSWELCRMSPEQFDEKLAWATTIIFGDAEVQSLHLNPSCFNGREQHLGFVQKRVRCCIA
jgi:hypothetical protein